MNKGWVLLDESPQVQPQPDYNLGREGGDTVGEVSPGLWTSKHKDVNRASQTVFQDSVSWGYVVLKKGRGVSKVKNSKKEADSQIQTTN